MRRKGSKNTIPAKTGQPRGRCWRCKKRRYLDDLVMVDGKGAKKRRACKIACKFVVALFPKKAPVETRAGH